MKKNINEGLSKEISELKSREGYLYAGLPKFRALFGRDSIISSWELLDYDPGIAIKTLNALASLQGKKVVAETGEYPGKILHEYYDDPLVYEERKKVIPWLKRGPSFFSVDSTPLFIILFSEARQRKKMRFSKQLTTSVDNALSFLLNYGFGNYFLGYEKAVIGGGLQSQSWRDGIGDIMDRLKSPVSPVGVQGYAYYALVKMKEIMREGIYRSSLDLTETIENTERRIRDLRENLDNYFWIDETSYYALACDGDGVAETAVTSDPAHLLFSGMLSRKREKDIIQRIFEDDMITEFGVRSLSSKDPRFDAKAYQRGAIWPQDNWIIAMGLKRRGYLKEYREIRERIIAAYIKMGKMPEYFSVTRDGTLIYDNLRIAPCYPQAWSTGAMISFL
ncbi:MAG: hypothetical protein LVQ96_01505 [Thermoplasmatales archaeon]|nr:hypothetical protein [Thermoplasmatales archaeon]MCW6169830.1 hypothetical protein [Thermoplasmatales archaeon]